MEEKSHKDNKGANYHRDKKETGCSFCKHCLNYIRHMLSKMLVSIAKFPFVTTVERSFIFVTHPHKPY